MTDNLEYWNKMARPPLDALKTIKGGRLSGMSNISPQWRYKVMTENFGMVGFGWKYEVASRWTSPGANDEHFAFAEIKLYVKVGDEWSAPIPGEGGSMLVAKEKNGYHNSDEAFKMAVTDALGTAMAKLGVAADIYLAKFDGSKYNDTEPFKKTVNTPAQAKEVTPNKDSKSVDEEFNGKFSVADLKSKATIEHIKKETKKEIPVILETIKSLDEEKKYAIEEIVDMLGDKDG